MYWPDELPQGTHDGKKTVQGRQHPRDGGLTPQVASHAVLHTLDKTDTLEKIDFLLTHGVKPALSAGTCGTPLQTGCAAFHKPGEFTVSESRVRHLLEKCPGLDVNKRGGLFGCAL